MHRKTREWRTGLGLGLLLLAAVAVGCAPTGLSAESEVALALEPGEVRCSVTGVDRSGFLMVGVQAVGSGPTSDLHLKADLAHRGELIGTTTQVVEALAEGDRVAETYWSFHKLPEGADTVAEVDCAVTDEERHDIDGWVDAVGACSFGPGPQEGEARVVLDLEFAAQDANQPLHRLDASIGLIDEEGVRFRTSSHSFPGFAGADTARLEIIRPAISSDGDASWIAESSCAVLAVTAEPSVLFEPRVASPCDIIGLDNEGHMELAITTELSDQQTDGVSFVWQIFDGDVLVDGAAFFAADTRPLAGSRGSVTIDTAVPPPHGLDLEDLRCEYPGYQP